MVRVDEELAAELLPRADRDQAARMEPEAENRARLLAAGEREPR